MGALAMIADQFAPIKTLLTFYQPTGPLSGVTTTAVLAWWTAWAILEARWRKRDVDLKRVNTVALILLALGFLLTFPPFADLL